MRNKINLKKSWFCLLFLCLFCFSACEKDLDEYYEVPSWLKGNTKEILEKRGNFSIFLKAIDKIGYTGMIDGKGVLTVIAPTDEAFTKWLSANNYGSIDAVPIDDLNKLITFHLVYYSFDKDKFANFRPEGAANVGTTTEKTAGLYYKFRTKSRDGISTVIDHTVAPNEPEVQLNIVHNDRFLPVMSSYLFQTKEIDAKYNYEYFFPQTTWSGQNGGFNISNAVVDEYAIVADNGFIYVVDRVLDMQETIRGELEKSANYSTFLKMYDRFVAFTLDANATTEYGVGDLYRQDYTTLPGIASEWPVLDYWRLDLLARGAHNVFAPTNASLQSFFNSFWSQYYSSIDNVPFIPVFYLLYNHVNSGDVVFPEEISNGSVLSEFGNPVDFDVENTDLRKMCANGTLYGLNNIMVPRMFESVTAPLFRNPDYRSFLYMMHSAGKIPSLMSTNVDAALFIPTEKVLIDNTTISGNPLQYSNTNVNKYGSESVLIDSDDGFVSLGLSQMNTICDNHIGSRLMSHVGNYKIYKTQNAFEYLLLDESINKIYSSSLYNNAPMSAPDVTPIYTAYNGVAYELSGDNGMALTPETNVFKDLITKTPPADFTEFKNLSLSAGFAAEVPAFSFLLDRFIVLIPSNSAITAGIASGDIPPTSDVDGLKEYMKYYFINMSTSGFSDYPFAGANIQGTVNSFRTKSFGEYHQLTIIDNGTNLQIRDAKGNVVNVTNIFPYIYGDGAAYQIDGLLEFE